MKKIILVGLVSILSFIMIKCSYGAGFNSTAAGGTWSNASTWAEGSAPVEGSTVTITAGSTVTVRAPFNIGTNVAASTSLTINGWLDFPYDIDGGTWIFKGSININATSAKWTIGSSTAPVLSTNTVRLELGGGGSRSFNLTVAAGGSPGNIEWYGSMTSTNSLSAPYFARSLTRVSSSSNSLTTDRNIDAKVGQEWALSPSEANTQVDTMTVLSYTVATSSIVFDRNFTYSHSTGVYLANVSRNIVLISTSPASYSALFYKSGSSSIENNGRFILQNVRFEGIGGDSSWGFNLNGWGGTFNGCVFYRCSYQYVNTGNNLTFNDCITVKSRTGGAINADTSSGNNYNRCIYMVGLDAYLIALNIANNYTIDSCLFLGGYAVMRMYNNQGIVLRNCEAQCISYSEFYHNLSTAHTIYVDSYTYTNNAIVQAAGTNRPNNTYYIAHGANPNIVFKNFKSFSTASPSVAATYGFIARSNWQGGEIRCHNLNQEIGKNYVMSMFGSVAVETTTVHTAGNRGLRYESVTSLEPGFEYIKTQFKAPCNSNNTICLRGYIKTNASYGFSSSSSPYVKVYSDDNSLISYSTATTASQSDWELLSVIGTVTTTGTITVELYGRMSTGCTVYWDDFRLYVGDNVFALGKDWIDGYPVVSPIASTMDASNFWNASTTTFVTAGTFGYVLGNTLTDMDTNVNTLGVQIASSTVNILDAISIVATASDITEYFTNIVSDLGGNIYDMRSQIGLISTGTVTSAAVAASAVTNVFNFDTIAGEPGNVELVAGVYYGKAWMYKTGSKPVTMQASLWIRPTVGDPVFVSSSAVTITLTTTSDYYETYISVNAEIAINVTDRLAIRWFATSGTGSATTVTMDVGGINNSHWVLKQAISLNVTGITNAIAASSNTLSGMINTSSGTLNSQINTSSITLAGMINTSSTTLSGQISAISVDFSPISTQLSTSTAHILSSIDTSSNTLSGEISGIAIDLTPVLTAINTSTNTIISAVNLSSNTLSGMINVSSNTLNTQINTSSNTLSGQHTTIINEVHNSSITVNDVWHKTIYGIKTASETLKEIRRREP